MIVTKVLSLFDFFLHLCHQLAAHVYTVYLLPSFLPLRQLSLVNRRIGLPADVDRPFVRLTISPSFQIMGKRGRGSREKERGERGEREEREERRVTTHTHTHERTQMQVCGVTQHRVQVAHKQTHVVVVCVCERESLAYWTYWNSLSTFPQCCLCPLARIGLNFPFPFPPLGRRTRKEGTVVGSSELATLLAL